MANSTKSKSSRETAESISAEERQRMIAEAAYYRALNRGFQGGDPVDDWIAAERQIDQIFSDQAPAQTS